MNKHGWMNNVFLFTHGAFNKWTKSNNKTVIYVRMNKWMEKLISYCSNELIIEHDLNEWFSIHKWDSKWMRY